MGQVPGWMLRHQITITPFGGEWNGYGTPTTVRAFVATNNGSRWTKAGQVHYTTTTVFARLSTPGGVGSKVTLHDGRTGYVSARADKTAPGLPTPDHAELIVEVIASTGASPAGETVILLRRTANGTDRFGGDKFTTTEVSITGASVTLDTSAEDNDGGTRVTVNGTVILPPDVVVTPVDRMTVRGLDYDIVGTPETPNEVMGTATAGQRVRIRRQTG